MDKGYILRQPNFNFGLVAMNTKVMEFSLRFIIIILK